MDILNLRYVLQSYRITYLTWEYCSVYGATVSHIEILHPIWEYYVLDGNKVFYRIYSYRIFSWLTDFWNIRCILLRARIFSWLPDFWNIRCNLLRARIFSWLPDFWNIRCILLRARIFSWLPDFCNLIL